MIPSHLLQAYVTYFKHACYMPYPVSNYIKKTQVFKFILTQCVMYLYMYIYIYLYSEIFKTKCTTNYTEYNNIQ